MGRVGARKALHPVRRRKVLDQRADAAARRRKAEGSEPIWVGYVGVDDVDATAEKITRLGGAVHVPPTDASDISRFSVFTDPQAATLALFKWRNPGQQPPAAPDAPGRVGWHELLAADGEQAWAFYGDLFGWQKEDADISEAGTYQPFSAGGQMIGGMFTKPETIPAPFWLYYFNVGDIDATAQRVEAGGGQILDGPFEVPGGSWVIRCTDPQGAVFALEGTRRTSPSDISSAPRARMSPAAHEPEMVLVATRTPLIRASDCVPRPSANCPTGPSTWNSIPVILANRSILLLPIAHPPSPMSVAIR